MGKSSSPHHSETVQFSITTTVFIRHELDQMIGAFGTSRSEIAGSIIDRWLTDNKTAVRDRIAEYEKFKRARDRRKARQAR
jgi:hypothetical protein